MFNVQKVPRAPGLRSACAVACGVMLSGVLPGVVWADDQLEPLVVTATRIPTRINRLTADVTVFDREQIEQSSGKSLADLLAGAPGVQIAVNGGLGKSSSAYVRGGDAKQTVLVIDGVRYGSATLGQPVLEGLPLDMIERVEVVRGALASLYGADAASGVVQVFTRQGRAGLHPSASVTVGSNRYHDETLGFQGGQGDWTYSVQASDQATSGFSATNPRVGSNYDPDRDGYRQQSFNSSASLRLNADWVLSGNVLRMYGKNWYDDGMSSTVSPSPNTNSLVSTSVSGVSIKGQVVDTWATQLRVAQSEDVSDTREAVHASYRSRIATTQTQVTWENTFDVGLGHVLAAAEHTYQGVSNTLVNFDRTSRTINALLLGWSGSQGDHDWQVNARRDHNSQYGDEDTGTVGYGYHLGKAWRVSGSAGTSFVAPSFNQLYYPGFGKPGLQPQHGLNRELGVDWSGDVASAKLVRYDNRIRDFINTSLTTVTNVDSVRLGGWTLSGRLAQPLGSARLYLDGSLDWLDAHRVSDDTRLTRRAGRVAQLQVGAAQDRLDTSVSLRASSGAPDQNSDFKMDHLPGYAIWGLNASYKLNQDWKLSFRGENVGNHAYETVWGFNMPRSQYFLTLAYAPVAR